MALRQRFETLLLFDPNRSPATANVSISRPSPSEEQVLGKLVIISNIAGNDRVNLDIISLIQDELRSSYYQAVDTKPERAFEQALHQTNKRLHQVITDGISSWVEQSSILVAVVWRDLVIMSSIGSIHAYLLRRSVRDGRSSFGMHSILDPISGPINPVRIFPHTITGQLQADDQLLFCTPSLLDYFSLEKLRRTLADGRPDEAVHHWESTLLGVEQRSAFAAVVIQTQSYETVTTPMSRPIPQSTVSTSAPQVSMDHLIAKEQATERLLSPSMWPAVRDAVSQIWLAMSGAIRRLLLHKPPRRVVNKITQQAPTALPSRRPLWKMLRRSTLIFFSSLAQFVRSAIPKKVSVRQPAPSVSMPPVIKKKWRPSLNTVVIWFQHLSRRQQLLSATSVLLVVILAVAVLPKNTASPESATDTASTSTITDELAKAKAAILYGGDETAAQNLATARSLYGQLPNRTSKEKSARQAAQTEIDTVTKLLAKVTTITSPTIIAQLAAVAPLDQPQQVYLAGTKLITLDPERSIAINTNIDGKTTPSVIENSLDTGAPQTGVTISTSSIIFSTDRQGFLELDVTKNTWKPLDSAWPASQPRVQALAFYQARLYAMDTANNSIVRFARSTNTLGTGVKWLKEPATLSAARGLSVDGSIYILQDSGIVETFTNGRKSSFSLTAIEPTLSNPTRMWTDSVSTKLYLVDPSNKRIVVFSKTGKLLNQYQSDSWNNLRDIAVDEKTKTVYVLSGTTLSSFTATQ